MEHGSCTSLLCRSTPSFPHSCIEYKTCCLQKGVKRNRTFSHSISDEVPTTHSPAKQFPSCSKVLRVICSTDQKASQWRSHCLFYSQGFEASKVAEPFSLPFPEEAGDGASRFHLGQHSLEADDTKPLLNGWVVPPWLWRAISVLIIAGQVILRTLRGKVHVRNTLQQLKEVGPRSVGVNILTASFVGMVFTIQFVREFSKLGLTRSVGGVLSLALARELSPVVTAVIVAGRVGSAFAAELGTMQVSEQTDTLRVLRTDPVDYLVTPRVIACAIAMPLLTLMAFTVGMAASVLLADCVYRISANIILDSAVKALQPWDIISTMIKSVVFGGVISIVSCAWGVTTLGGAKGVGESTTSAVVISLVCIFIADFVLSWCFFQGAGDALKAAMG